MRQAYAHQAVLVMGPEADTGAPGAAITTALCGHWEHDPPCPLAPHHTGVVRDGERVRLRVLFATEPHRVDEVRRRIDAALSQGALPEGSPKPKDSVLAAGPPTAGGDWLLEESGCARIAAEERDHARRLLKSR